MKLKDRVRITDLGIETDNPPVGYITSIWLKYIGTPLEEEWATVTFDNNLIEPENRQLTLILGRSEGVPRLVVETSRLEMVE